MDLTIVNTRPWHKMKTFSHFFASRGAQGFSWAQESNLHIRRWSEDQMFGQRLSSTSFSLDPQRHVHHGLQQVDLSFLAFIPVEAFICKLWLVQKWFPNPIITSVLSASSLVRLRMTPDGTLVIRNMEKKDGGVYACLGSNQAGTDSMTSILSYIGEDGTCVVFYTYMYAFWRTDWRLLLQPGQVTVLTQRETDNLTSTCTAMSKQTSPSL